MSKGYLLFTVISGLVVFAACCGDNEFRCRDGTCIPKTMQCNGQPGCRDWSDETQTLCQGITRPFWNIVFACSNERVRRILDDVCPRSCIGNPIDCAIALFANGVQVPTDKGKAQSCSYPAEFRHGKVSVNGNIDLGDKKASHGSDLRFSCNRRFELKGKSKVFCQFGQWSDEFPTCVRSSKDRCVLPRHPDHGQYIFPNNTARPGEHFEDLHLYFSCDAGHRLMGSNTVMCHQGNWTSAIPTCQKLCKLNPHVSVHYKCMVVDENGVSIGSRECGQFEPEGTAVMPRCRSPNYYHPGVLRHMHCNDGNWDYVAVCEPECGRVTPDGVTNELGGRPAGLGEIPWHAGIYNKEKTPYEQICGGTLVSTNMVISAAHCFWNESKQALNPATKYAVALGKIYRSWDDARDTSSQQFDVENVIITDQYLGSLTLFQEDIALVLLSRPAVYHLNVRPACVDFETTFERNQLESGKKGKIAGWGLTGVNGPYSETLQLLELPFVTLAVCIHKAPVRFRQYIQRDKFCAGYWAGGKAVCSGDSGGGLAFAATEWASERYYLRGVASAAPKSRKDLCNSQTVSTFTQISQFEVFIKKYLSL